MNKELRKLANKNKKRAKKQENKDFRLKLFKSKGCVENEKESHDFESWDCCCYNGCDSCGYSLICKRCKTLR